MNIKEFLERGGDYFLPNMSIDLVIIGYEDHALKCLLLRMGERWLLPGGYIGANESVDDSAKQILSNRTGLEDPHLQFLSVFGKRDRKFRDEWKQFFERSGLDWKEDYWINNRFVSLVYYSLVNTQHTHPMVGNFDEAFAWFPFDELPDMWMDHKDMVLEARKRLKDDIHQEQLSYKLLPEEFTMPELHRLHQTILEEKLDRSRFQKKMLASGLFERLPERHKDAPGRNPYQYRVK
ncbi:MAG: NUDIX domain-containing protein [Saprospiraceae bacterium]|nr:NUDIX hydrolase [Lewinella sp.]